MSITEEIDLFIAKEGGGNIRDALNIEECPSPKLPYGMNIVEIAKKALGYDE